MRFIVMFITAVCVLFLIKLRWPKKKSIYSPYVLIFENALSSPIYTLQMSIMSTLSTVRTCTGIIIYTDLHSTVVDRHSI